MGSADSEATVRRLYRTYAEQDGTTLPELFAECWAVPLRPRLLRRDLFRETDALHAG